MVINVQIETMNSRIIKKDKVGKEVLITGGYYGTTTVSCGYLCGNTLTYQICNRNIKRLCINGEEVDIHSLNKCDIIEFRSDEYTEYLKKRDKYLEYLKSIKKEYSHTCLARIDSLYDEKYKGREQ